MEFTTLSREAARAFYDRFGAKQDWQSFYEDPALHDLVVHAGFEQTRAAVEFGCGTGRFAESLLSTILPADALYVGVDASTTMTMLAHRRLERFGSRAVVLRSDGSPRVAAKDGSCDRFVSIYVLDLLSHQDIASVLLEARRLLKPEGRLCLVCLTWGGSLFPRLVTGIWAALHRLRPSLVGGCRPLELLKLIPETDWRIRYHHRLSSYGIPSEILVAQKRAHGHRSDS